MEDEHFEKNHKKEKFQIKKITITGILSALLIMFGITK